ncbi:hypothetical protein KKA03_00300, partial [archaeon]|nr:hypothetical protein [archaeon]
MSLGHRLGIGVLFAVIFSILMAGSASAYTTTMYPHNGETHVPVNSKIEVFFQGLPSGTLFQPDAGVTDLFEIWDLTTSTEIHGGFSIVLHPNEPNAVIQINGITFVANHQYKVIFYQGSVPGDLQYNVDFPCCSTMYLPQSTIQTIFTVGAHTAPTIFFGVNETIYRNDTNSDWDAVNGRNQSKKYMDLSLGSINKSGACALENCPKNASKTIFDFSYN